VGYLNDRRCKKEKKNRTDKNRALHINAESSSHILASLPVIDGIKKPSGARMATTLRGPVARKRPMSGTKVRWSH